MVTGGLAAVIYGHPRMTVDIDLVVWLGRGDAIRFNALWPADAFYVPPIEVIREEADRSEHGHFNVSHHETAMRADVYLPGADELNAWAFRRRVIREIEGERVQIAPIEAVILGKLKYYKASGSDRHLRDIARMLAVSGDEIDQPALVRWISRLELDAAWERAQNYQESP